MISKAALYWRTIRHLRTVQIVDRVTRRLRPRPAVPGIAPPPRAPVFELDAALVKPRSFLGPRDFRFLGEERAIESGRGWYAPGASRLWTYNLHYFEGLANPDTSERLKRQIVGDWIESNPPGVGAGWEPYPTSQRIVNWIKWVARASDVPIGFDLSLCRQVRYLERYLEFHLLGNHLFANAKALTAAGLYFRGDTADRWRRRGEAILESELGEQFLPDGGHFELSPVYHALLTEDLLDLLSLYRAYGFEGPVTLGAVAERAMEWLAVMTGPDGHPALFNDAALGVASTHAALAEKADRLGVRAMTAPARGTRFLEASGYVRHDEDRYALIADVGPIGPDYIPGHGHCDMLSVVVWQADRPLLVDTGTSTYEVGARRLIERSTSSHNTVQIGSYEQSEVWGSFRVARRAELLEVSVSPGVVRAAARIVPARPVVHRRLIECRSRTLSIVDTLERVVNEPDAVARFHFHPDAEPSLSEGRVTAGSAVLSFEGADAVSLRPYEYAPRFNTRVPAQRVEVRFRDRLRTEITL